MRSHSPSLFLDILSAQNIPPEKDLDVTDNVGFVELLIPTKPTGTTALNSQSHDFPQSTTLSNIIKLMVQSVELQT